MSYNKRSQSGGDTMTISIMTKQNKDAQDSETYHNDTQHNDNWNKSKKVGIGLT